MNKLLTLATFAVGALLINGCSSSDRLAPLEVPNSSSQEILFSSMQTRASFDNETGSDWSTDNVSVSCLAKTKQETTDHLYDINWTKQSKSGKQYFIQMANIDASVDQGKFFWANHYYYPDDSFAYNYTFRGYYPRQANDQIKWGEYSMKVAIPVDGTSDILYGLADSDEAFAYSSRYFKENSKKDILEILPALTFTHSLARLTFKMKSGVGSDDNLKVKYIRAIHMYSKVELTVADLGAPLTEGKVSVMGDNDASYTLKDKFGYDVTNYTLSKTFTSVGESMLVYPTESIPEEDNKGYQFEIGIEDPNDATKTITSTPTLLPATGKAFEAGLSYNIQITIDGVEKTSMESVLKPWE